MRKWITKKEIDKIKKTYSVRKDEFLPVEGKEHFYQSQLLSSIKEMREQLSAIQMTPQESQLLINDTTSVYKLEQMQEQIKLLEAENQQLKRKIGHNARGAGRKPSKKCSDAIQQLKELIHLDITKMKSWKNYKSAALLSSATRKVSTINLQNTFYANQKF